MQWNIHIYYCRFSIEQNTVAAHVLQGPELWCERLVTIGAQTLNLVNYQWNVLGSPCDLNAKAIIPALLCSSVTTGLLGISTVMGGWLWIIGSKYDESVPKCCCCHCTAPCRVSVKRFHPSWNEGRTSLKRQMFSSSPQQCDCACKCNHNRGKHICTYCSRNIFFHAALSDSLLLISDVQYVNSVDAVIFKSNKRLLCTFPGQHWLGKLPCRCHRTSQQLPRFCAWPQRWRTCWSDRKACDKRLAPCPASRPARTCMGWCYFMLLWPLLRCGHFRRINMLLLEKCSRISDATLFRSLHFKLHMFPVDVPKTHLTHLSFATGYTVTSLPSNSLMLR